MQNSENDTKITTGTMTISAISLSQYFGPDQISVITYLSILVSFVIVLFTSMPSCKDSLIRDDAPFLHSIGHRHGFKENLGDTCIFSLREIHVSSCFSLVPMIFDFIAEIYFGGKNNNDNPRRIPIVARLLLILSLIIPSATYLAMANTSIIIGLYQHLVYLQNFVMVIAVAITTSQLYPKRFLMKIWVAILIPMGSSFIYRIHEGVSELPSYGFYILCGIAVFLYLVLIVVWRRNSYVIDNFTVSPDNQQDNFICYLYLAIPAIILSCQSIVDLVTNCLIWSDASETNLSANMAITLVFTQLLWHIPDNDLLRVVLDYHRKLSMKSSFVRLVSHEIRSPLTLVQATLMSILDPTDENADEEDFYETIEASNGACQTAISLLNDLLHFESLEAGNFKLELASILLPGALQKKLVTYKHLAKAYAVELRIIDLSGITGSERTVFLSGITGNGKEVHPDRFSLHVDIYRIDQVIRNLVTNALKFTQSGGAVTIIISHSTQLTDLDSFAGSGKWNKLFGGVLTVEVVDTGSGMSKENMANLFKEFSQFERNKLQGGNGSGLGLWICKKFIDMHGGVIGATSDGEGLGSRFFFQLPLFVPRTSRFPRSKLSSYSDDDNSILGHTGVGKMKSVKDYEEVSVSSQASMKLRRFESPRGVHRSNDSESSHNSTILRHPQFVDPHNNDQSSLNPDPAPIVIESQHGKKSVPESKPITPKRLKILLVDDSALNRKAVANMMNSGFKTTIHELSLDQAEDGSIAVEKVEEAMANNSPFDAIFLDNWMAKMVTKINHKKKTLF